MGRNTVLFYKVMRRIKPLSPLSHFFNKKKHSKIMSQLDTYFKLASKQSVVSANSPVINNNNFNIIWVFWWQGEQSMPPLVQKCYQSICQNRGHYRVILITKFNIEQFAKLPDYIYIKLNNRQMSITHFSDILRFNLLRRYGGLWMDITCLALDNLNKIDVEHELFTTSDYQVKDNFNVSQGRWTGFLIGGPANLKLFNFMDIFFRLYWKDNDQLLDYFLIDYALNYAFEHNISDLQKISIQYNNFVPHLFDLQRMLSLPYNDPRLIKLMHSGVYIFKMSNRRKIKNISDPNILFNHLDSLYHGSYRK